MQTLAILLIYIAAVPLFFGTLNLSKDMRFNIITSKQLPIILILISIGMLIIGSVLYLSS